MYPKYAQIIVNIPHQQVGHPFTYTVPPELAPAVRPGVRVTVSFGARKGIEGYVLAVSDVLAEEPRMLKPVLEVLDKEPVLNGEQLDMIPWLQKECHAKALDIIRLLVSAELRSGRVREKYATLVSLAVSQEEAEAAQNGLVRPGTKAYTILSLLQESGELEKSYLTQMLGDVQGPVKSLVERGLVVLSKKELVRSPYMEIAPENKHWHPLTDRQKEIFETVTGSMEAGGGAFLLHGITGSGKTEIYMRVISHAVAMGKSAIVLVPEISLTPQMVRSFRERLGDKIAVLHSALSMGERFDEWRRIQKGEANIVIGARSAIFAPVQNIGLIVVDEEHESSYVSDSHPRYDAVEVAAWRAKYNGGVLLLGSATPSVVRYYQALQGKYKLLQLKERINRQPLPQVELVNMADEFASGNRSIFSRRLYELLDNTLQQKKQAMLFLNRRGYSSFVMCRACGETVSCENCDVSLTYHSGDRTLRCHYCGYEIPLPTECPSCGSKYIKQFGAGTQKVEEEFAKLFPQAKALRMDVDTTRTKDAHYHILKKFADGEAQVLVGTQMIAKGHDFPMVALVGVIAAETLLQLPDYRSRERTFSLITQVAGRAGRADTKGRVVVQTYTPRHFAVLAAAKHDYEGFFRQEIAERQAMWYPPFARFLRILYTAENSEDARRHGQEAFDRIRSTLWETPLWKENYLYAQAGPAPIGRLKGMSRYQILIKCKETDSTGELTDRLFALVESLPLKDTYRSVEVNPTNLF